MNKRLTNSIIGGIILLFLSFSTGYGQGDNTPDPTINLGLLEDAVVSGSVAPDSGRGLATDILYDPAIQGFRNPTDWQEYGVNFMENLGPVTKDDPFYWMVEWPTAKNINYITCGGVYGNQPQPNTMWAVQYWNDSVWVDVAKAHNGWVADTLAGKGKWLDQGILQWRGLEPVVTTKLRIITYSMPDSDLVSIHFRARGGDGKIVKDADQPIKAVLIQYLDFSGAVADNEMDDLVNLGLLDESVVSAAFAAGELENIRGEPADILFDLVKGNFNNTDTPWAEFGYPWQYDAGFLEEDNPFYWMVEWPVPKNINFFTWGGVYGNQPQPTTPWAVQYWDGSQWVNVMDGVGGSFAEGLPGVDSDAQSVWQSDTPIQTTKFRLAVWSDGIDPLFSYTIRGRGGSTQNWDETDSTFKALLVQYKELATAIESDDLVKPTEFALHQNYPNPFNPQTNIEFILPENSHVRLAVYNIRGQEVSLVVDEMKLRGTYKISFDAKSLSSGVYYYQLKTNQGVLTKKMILLK